MKTHRLIIVVALSCLLLLISACGKKSIRGVSGVEDSSSQENTVSDEALTQFDEALSGDSGDAGAVQALSVGDFSDGQGDPAFAGRGQESSGFVFPGSTGSGGLGSSAGVGEMGNNKSASRALTRDQLTASGNTGAHDTTRGNGTHDSQGLRDVFFAYDSWRLSEQSHRILEANAKWLKAHSHARVTIEGHCDERGTRAYNYVLGDRRAEMAKQYLAHLGIPVHQMTVISYGKDQPVCHAFSKACFQSNRRVHFSMDVNMASRD